MSQALKKIIGEFNQKNMEAQELKKQTEWHDTAAWSVWGVDWGVDRPSYSCTIEGV